MTAVDHYEDKELADKIVKHLKGFAQLLEYQRENDLISERAYQALKEDTGYLMEKYE
ncbi:FIMAH domain-containing protein [Lentibacillus jeotgali]|uniref:FIMAH domain-containing protein n=1 Tax=Lentibacillus jeotgali TaxID=558169 RepID=UPI00026287C2